MEETRLWLHHVSSPLGGITLASDGEALLALCFDGQKYFERSIPTGGTERALPLFTRAEDWLAAYFGGEKPDFTPPLRLRGTAFQQAVWALLLTIPYGETRTYGELSRALAREMGRPGLSAQAVGGAVGRNPVSLIVPCHRVVGAHGALTGYAGGIARKEALLRLEGALR